MSKAKHDQFFSRSLEYPAIAQAFIYQHSLIYLREKVDWGQLVRVDRTNTDDTLKQRRRDIIYKAPFLNEEGTVFFAIEHQSENDPTIPIRFLRYTADNLENHLNEGNKKWPLLVNILLYHGTRAPYPLSCESTDYYENPLFGKQELWFRFHVIDLTQLSDEEILTYGLCAPLEILLKHSRDGAFELKVEAYRKVFHACTDQVGDKYIYAMLSYAYSLEDLKVGEKIHKFVKEVYKLKPEIIMTYGELLTKEARLEARLEGIEEGMEKGIEKGMEKGMKKEKLVIAKNMLRKGCEISFMQEVTGLSKEEVEKLKQE
jgi:predicted transposase YdaD